MGDRKYLVIWANNEINNVYVVLASTEEDAKDKVREVSNLVESPKFELKVYDLAAIFEVFEDYDSNVWAYSYLRC